MGDRGFEDDVLAFVKNVICYIMHCEVFIKLNVQSIEYMPRWSSSTTRSSIGDFIYVLTLFEFQVGKIVLNIFLFFVLMQMF